MDTVKTSPAGRRRFQADGSAGIRAWCCVAIVCLAVRQPALADLPAAEVPGNLQQADELARAYVEASVERTRLQAGNAFLAEELQRLEIPAEGEAAVPAILAELTQVDAEMRRTLADLLDSSAAPLVDDLHQVDAELDQRSRQAEDVWIALRAERNRALLLLSRIRGSRRVAGQLASLLSVDKRWFWLFGVVAVATLLGLVCHDRRHDLRRRLNGGRAKAMGLSKFLAATLVVLAGATLATFLMGDRIYEALLSVGTGGGTSPRRALRAELAEVEAQRDVLAQRRQEWESRYESKLDAFRRALGEHLPARNRLPVRYKQFRRDLLGVTESLAVLGTLAGSIEADRAELTGLVAQLKEQTQTAAWYLRVQNWIRGLLGAALLGLAVSGGLLYRRGVAARRRHVAATCPLCLGVGRLRPVAEPPSETEAPELRVVRCQNVISREPYQECDFFFKEAYRPMTKLCFPTLGIPQAGKTHWLSMVYWGLNRGNYPKAVQFEKVKSRSSEDFDRIVEEILRTRIGTAATQQDRIPHPLVFNFRDHDPLGCSNVLVNIFDYSGEVTSEMGADDYRRRRALEGDGFFFFLDPTYPSETQAKALADFREDLRLVKRIRAGRQLRTPVALCVSKIDLLAGQGYTLPDGRDAIAQFYQDLSRIDPSGESTRRSVIEARSRLTAELRDTIWPGWRIERQIGDLFGGRLAFFPLTPVGLDGRGETDLSLRTISPFGLLEPLLWLLEMNGYPVLG